MRGMRPPMGMGPRPPMGMGMGMGMGGPRGPWPPMRGGPRPPMRGGGQRPNGPIAGKLPVIQQKGLNLCTLKMVVVIENGPADARLISRRSGHAPQSVRHNVVWCAHISRPVQMYA
jgi:hypothetical protein